MSFADSMDDLEAMNHATGGWKEPAPARYLPEKKSVFKRMLPALLRIVSPRTRPAGKA